MKINQPGLPETTAVLHVPIPYAKVTRGCNDLSSMSTFLDFEFLQMGMLYFQELYYRIKFSKTSSYLSEETG